MGDISPMVPPVLKCFDSQKEKLHQTLTQGAGNKDPCWETPDMDTHTFPARLSIMHSFHKLGDISSLKLQGDALLIGKVP